VRVHDLIVAARIGAYPHEEGRRQKLRIAVSLDVEPVLTDQLQSTVDYAAVVAHAEALADTHIALIETFARRLAAACLAEAGVLRAEVEVEKPSALANGVASASVILAR
jgi:7,8-dihydroneopterin aldolase/epimerase/oxygenase